MSNDCCNERPNFGHPACIEDLGTVSRFMFVGLPLGPSAYILASALDYESILGYTTDFSELTNLWRPFPEVQNFVWTPAESQFEEASNGKKSWLKNGKISIACETWDGDATAKMVAKMQALRCSDWGMLLITDNNKLIGSYNANGGVEKITPIKIDSQSIEALFQLKTDSATQKIMFNFDLDRNFDVSTLYAIDGDLIWDATNEVIAPVDFNNDLPNVIDCQLNVGTVPPTVTNIGFKVNDDYRQGTRNESAGDALGNVTGLTVSDFLVENLTDGTTITPTSVTETLTGYYVIVSPTQTAGDRIKVSLAIPTQTQLNGQVLYQGSLTVVIP